MTDLALAVTTVWVCTSGCGAEYRTRRDLPNRLHTCPRQRYLAVPMVRQGTRAKVELREREDYVGREIVQLDPERRRPVMSIITSHDDGRQDCIVLAPSATASIRVGHALAGKARRGYHPTWRTVR